MPTNQAGAIVAAAKAVSDLAQQYIKVTDNLMKYRDLVLNGDLNLDQVDVMSYPELAGLGDWDSLRKFLVFVNENHKSSCYRDAQKVASLIVK